MEAISFLQENCIFLVRKKEGLTYRWLFLNEENDLIRKKKRVFVLSGPPGKEVPKGNIFIWSVSICHLTPVSVVAWLWEACDEVFQRDLFPLCPLSGLDSIGCLLFGARERALTPSEIISDPACFSSYLLHLMDLIGRREKTGSSSTVFGVSGPTQSCLPPVFLFRALSCSCCWLLLPHPSGVCVTGMRFGSSVIVSQETWKDSGHWGPLLDRTWTDVLLVPWKPFPGVRQLHRSVLASDLKFPFYTPGVHCNILSSVLP